MIIKAIQKISIVVGSLLLFQFTSALANVKENFTIATWNLEHWMSETDFFDWKDLCGGLNWVEPIDRDKQFPEHSHLPYCNALNGQRYNPDSPVKIESRPIRKFIDWEAKRKQISDTLEMVNADIIAFQEVSGISALKEVLDSNEYVFYGTQHQGVRQQLAFAIRKKLVGKSITEPSFEVLEELAVKAPNGHQVRPGAILTISIYGRQFSFLNIHLKAGCSVRPIGINKVDEKQNRIEACSALSKQIPILENWIESQFDKRTVVLGDFNRTRDFEILAARFDGSNASDPHISDTVYASLFRELIDGVPKTADLSILGTSNYSNVSGCRVGIDHIAINEFLIQAEDYNRRVLGSAILPFSSGKAPQVHEVKTSDHCPVITRLKIKRDKYQKPVRWLQIRNSLDVSEHQGKSVSTWLYGYDERNSKKIVLGEEDCSNVKYSDTLVCRLLFEQKRQFTLPLELSDILHNLSEYFVDKVHRVVNGEHLVRYHAFLKGKGSLSTVRLEEDDLRYIPSKELPEKENPLGKYIRPHIMQATAGIGVNVILDEFSQIYNVGYVFGRRTPGRSYSIGIENTANDISYDELFEKLNVFLLASSKDQVKSFYQILFELLLESKTDKLKELPQYAHELMVDILTVYLAEGFRHHTGASSAFHDDLITVIMISPWALVNRVVITRDNIVPMDDKQGLKGFIVREGSSSGLGFAREERKSIQRVICSELKNMKKSSSTVVEYLSNNGDCIYGFVKFLRSPTASSKSQVDTNKVIDWIVDDIPSIKL